MTPADGAVVDTVMRFADEVNRGDVAAALSRFTDDPSIVEDLPPFYWRGADAGMAWLHAMAANAERLGMSGIHMAFSAPTIVLVDGERAYAVFPGVLTYSFADGPDRQVDGYVTFGLELSGSSWQIQTLTWSWVREAA